MTNKKVQEIETGQHIYVTLLITEEVYSKDTDNTYEYRTFIKLHKQAKEQSSVLVPTILWSTQKPNKIINTRTAE